MARGSHLVSFEICSRYRFRDQTSVIEAVPFMPSNCQQRGVRLKRSTTYKDTRLCVIRPDLCQTANLASVQTTLTQCKDRSSGKSNEIQAQANNPKHISQEQP